MATKRHQLFIGDTLPTRARLGDLWSDTSGTKPVSKKCTSVGPPPTFELSEIAAGTESQTLRYNNTTKVWEASSVIKNDGTNVGINVAGVLTEKLEIGGSIKVGNRPTVNPVLGTIRFTGTDYEAYLEGAWRSLTAGSAAQSSSQGTKMRVESTAGTQSIPNATWTKVQMNATPTFDTNSEWDNVNHRFVAKQAGYYEITGQMYILSAVDSIMSLKINGVNRIYAGAGNSSNSLPNITDSIYLNVGDYVDLWIEHFAGGARTLANNSNVLTVTRIDQLAVGAGAVATTGHQTTKVKAYQSVAQSIPSHSETQVNLQSKAFDTNDEFSTTTSKFTAKQAGYYWINGQVALSASSSSYIRILKNGILLAITHGGPEHILAVSVLDYLNVGDNISLTIYHSLGSSNLVITGSNSTFLDISRCDPLTGGLGDWETKAIDTVYQAPQDGFVVAEGTIETSVYTDGNNPPTTIRGASQDSITVPVRKGDYWKVTGADIRLYWILNTGGSGGSINRYTQNFVNGDLTAGKITITHRLNNKLCIVQVYDGSDKQIIPDDVTLLTNNTLELDMTTYVPLVGTYKIIVI